MAFSQYLSNVFLYGNSEDKGYSFDQGTVTIATGMASGALLVKKAGKFVHVAAADLASVATPTVQNSAAYTVSLSVAGLEKLYTYTSDASATATEIADGLAALIEADTDVNALVSAANVSDTLAVTSDAGDLFTLKALTDNLEVQEWLSSLVVLCDEKAEVDGGLAAGDHTLEVIARDAGVGKDYLTTSDAFSAAQLSHVYSALGAKGIKVETQY